MSALDQAFIKAYAKEPAATAEPRSAGQDVSSYPLAVGDAPYHDGSLYRVDVPHPAPRQGAVPQPHQQFARTGNALRSRFTTPTAAPETIAPAVPPQQEISSLLPRPMKAKTPALAEIAQQLSGNQPVPFAASETSSTQYVELTRERLRNEISPETQEAETIASPPPTTSQADTLPVASGKKKYRFDGGATVLRGPHFQIRPDGEAASEILPAEAPKISTESQAVSDVPTEAPAAEVEKPATAEMASAAITETESVVEKESPAPPATAPQATAAGVAAAAWEVDAFQWPVVCTELLSDKESYFSQAGKKLLAALQDGLKTMAIAGGMRGDGCSTLALVLARVAAEAGVDVALVDADFADPQLGTQLGLELTCSWHEIVAKNLPLTEAAVRSVNDKLTLYPLEKNKLGLSLSDPRVSNIWSAISALHALTIIDLGPLPAGDAPIFAEQDAPPIDAVVIVRDVRRTPLEHAQAVATRLYANGVDAVGLAENFVGSPSS